MNESGSIVSTDLPQRLDRLPWGRFHSLVVAALGITWILDGLEVTLAVLGFTNLNNPTIGTVLYWANSHSAMVVGVWWWLAIPVVLIVMTFLGLFLLAVSMNEYIDPRSRLRRMGA